eukprot:455673-Hanusia_phi.AAC.1
MASVQYRSMSTPSFRSTCLQSARASERAFHATGRHRHSVDGFLDLGDVLDSCKLRRASWIVNAPSGASSILLLFA